MLTSQHIRAIPENSRTPVHDIRVVLKSLRSGLKLCGRKTRGVPVRLGRLRTRARALTAVRDVEARQEIIAWLREQGVRVAHRYRIPARLRPGEIRRRVREAARQAEEAAVFLQAVLQQQRAPQLEKRLKHLARRITKAMRRYKQSPTPDNLHRLRKRVKDHQYQLRDWVAHPGDYGAEEKRLRHAGHELGLVRDLLRLREDIATTPTTSASRATLAALEALALRHRKRAIQHLRHF